MTRGDVPTPPAAAEVNRTGERAVTMQGDQEAALAVAPGAEDTAAAAPSGEPGGATAGGAAAAGVAAVLAIGPDPTKSSLYPT